MKILIIQNYGGLGGGSRSGFDVAKMFKNRGDDVSMLTDNPTTHFIDIANNNGIKLITKHPQLITYNFHSASGLAFKTPLKYFLCNKYYNLWVRFFEQTSYDLVVLNSSVLCPFSKLLSKLGIKNIIFVRETFRKNFFINKKQRFFLSASDAVIYLSEYDKSIWKANTKEYVIPDIVDPDAFCRLSQKANSAVDLLYLGGLNYYKGALDLLEAVKMLVARKIGTSFSLNILGETYNNYETFSLPRKLLHYKHVIYRQHCLKIIDEINQIKQNTVHLVGLTIEVSKYYANCDAVIFPVKKVHQPRPAYEAGYFGKMIIVPDYDNFVDNIFNRWNGLYYKKNSIISLTDTLNEVISDEILRNVCGENNRRFVEEKHSLSYAENCLDTILANFE